MRIVQMSVSVLMLGFAGACLAADTAVKVIAVGDIKPGVYGKVDLKGAPPPPTVNMEPVIMVKQVRVEPPAPIYLHVPPDQVKNWDKECRKYSACNVPVFFVKSAEFGQKKEDKKK